MATTDDVGATARRTLHGQEKLVGLVLRGQLLTEEVQWPVQIGGAGTRLPPWPVKPHQTTAIEAVVNGFRDHDRGRLIMACGTGKTLTALWIVERLQSSLTLVLVPSLSLVQQNLAEWGRNSAADFDTLIVCSDETVGRKNADEMVQSAADLAVKPTTDPEQIRHFLQQRRKRPAVVFATYQSSNRIAAAQAGKTKKFDLVICDESHRLAGDMEGEFATVLDGKKIKASKRLFMTATPRYIKDHVKRRAAELDTELVSMDDVHVFGPEFHVLEFYEAMNAKPVPLLTDYQVVVIGVTDRDAKAWAEEARLVRTTEDLRTDARTLAAQIGLAKAMQKYNLRKIITFHSTVAKAARFVDATQRDSLPGVISHLKSSVRPSGTLWTKHISGETPAGMRATLLKEFAHLPDDTRGILSNCACLGEGVDVPVLDGVAFIDPKRSMVDIIQAVGRVIRKAAGKPLGTIVIPVFIDESEDADHVLSQSAFEPVWQVLKALRAHDRRLADELDQLRLSLGKRPKSGGRINLPDNIKLDVPRLLLRNFEQAFYVRTVEQTTSRQFLSFADARHFVHSLQLTGITDWKRYCAGEIPGQAPRPDNIPSNPQLTYKICGWINWGDWFGTGNVAPALRVFRRFEQARCFVHSLSLKSLDEWRQYCKGEIQDRPPKPDDIPSWPPRIYQNQGWTSWGDWFGTGTVANHLREYRSFEDARNCAHTLGVKTKTAWSKYAKGLLPGYAPKPHDIPASPPRTYRDQGWVSWGDWLGTHRVATFERQFLPFVQARRFVRSLRLKNRAEWQSYCQGLLSGRSPKPDGLPTNPAKTYEHKGWVSMGDWLGTMTVATFDRKYRSHEKALQFVHSLGLKNRNEWGQYCNGQRSMLPPKPDDIPAAPDSYYQDHGWSGWGNWLGTGTIAPFLRTYRTFEDARQFSRSIGLKNWGEWGAYCKGRLSEQPPKPDDIPAVPSSHYRDKGWVSWGDWLGTGTIASLLQEFRPFGEAREFVWSLGLKSQSEWNQYRKGSLPGHTPKPNDIPSSPPAAYKDQGWISWGDWLGTGNVAPKDRKYRPFKVARKFIHSIGLKSHLEWRRYCTGLLPGKKPKPSDIPGNPYNVYKLRGWISWPDWLGTTR